MTSPGQRSRVTSIVSQATRSKSRVSRASTIGSDKASRSKTASPAKLSRQASIYSGFSFGPYRGSLLYRVDQSGFKIPRYQNTYRLEPYKPYKCEEVDKILSSVMHASLDNIKYEPVNCMKVCQDISANVRHRICKKDYDRYKFIVLISLIQKKGQHIHADTGRLWDAEKDTHSTCIVETTEFIAFGLVAATYYE